MHKKEKEGGGKQKRKKEERTEKEGLKGDKKSENDENPINTSLSLPRYQPWKFQDFTINSHIGLN